jgi:hypothetical protein
MPDAYNEKQSERGDVAALALGLAVREQAIVVPADVLAFFKSHPSRPQSLAFHALHSFILLFLFLQIMRGLDLRSCSGLKTPLLLQHGGRPVVSVFCLVIALLNG